MQCGPWGMPGESDLLFHNKGDGTFEEVSKKAGVDDPHHYYGLGATWGDYDNDGWPDLYVANDAGPNFLYRNKHDGTFEDVGLLAGVALSGDGMEQGSMGVDWGDYLHEGRLSMIVTNFVEQGSTLYHNLGKDNFADVSVRAKLMKPTYPYVSWGTAFFDMDNDGWLDLFIANGHVYPQVDTIPGGTPYRQPMLLFRNHRDGTFDDVSQALAQMPPQSRRGAAFGDINNDGNVDIVVLNVGEPPSLLLNRTRQRESSRALQAGRNEKQQSRNRCARHRKGGTLVQIQRSARRRQLSLAERFAPALWISRQRQNERSQHPLAERRNRSSARRAGGFYLHRSRGCGDSAEGGAAAFAAALNFPTRVSIGRCCRTILGNQSQ